MKGKAKTKVLLEGSKGRCSRNNDPFGSIGYTMSKQWKRKVERNVEPTLQKQELRY